jgi:hypothetical protein
MFNQPLSFETVLQNALWQTRSVFFFVLWRRALCLASLAGSRARAAPPPAGARRALHAAASQRLGGGGSGSFINQQEGNRDRIEFETRWR